MSQRSAIPETLARTRLLAGFTEEVRADLAREGTLVEVAAGQVVLREGDPPDGLYVVCAGRLRISRLGPDGSDVELGVATDADVFGEVALLDHGPRTASVTALERSTLFFLARPEFDAWLARQSAGTMIRVVQGLSASLREASERALHQKVHEHALRAEMEAERHRSLTRLVAGVAHEVNTPLGIVSTALSVVEGRLPKLGGDEVDLADVREALDLARRNLQRADKLVRDFKRVSAAEFADVPEAMELHEVVADAVALFQPVARKAGLRIAVEDDLPAGAGRFVGYRGALTQVVLNALTNVERYAYPGGGGGRVVVRLGHDGERFVLGIRDFGCGISEVDVERVFDPFFTTGRAHGGTGLGLAIVRNLVEGPLGGTVSIESRPGQGTSLEVVFPGNRGGAELKGVDAHEARE